MSMSLSVCLYRRISPITEPIWIFFAMLLLIGPGKFSLLFITKIKIGGEVRLFPPLQVLLEASNGVAARPHIRVAGY